MFALGAEGRPQRQQVVRLSGVGQDLDKLARVGEVVEEVLAGRMSQPDASAAVDAIAAVPVPFGRGALAASCALVGGGIAVLFGGSRIDTAVAAALGLVVYGLVLGTVAAVAFANLWSRRAGRPTSIVLIPSIVLLVSGSVGFRGLVAIAEGEVALGARQLLQMFVVAATIAAGLLVGNTLVRPKVTL